MEEKIEMLILLQKEHLLHDNTKYRARITLFISLREKSNFFLNFLTRWKNKEIERKTNKFFGPTHKNKTNQISSISDEEKKPKCPIS